MATYLIGFDARGSSTSPTGALASIGAVELWPGLWVLETQLAGIPLREALGPVADQAGYLLCPFDGQGTFAAGMSGAAAAETRQAMGRLIMDPIMSKNPVPAGMGKISERLNRISSGEAVGVGTT